MAIHTGKTINELRDECRRRNIMYDACDDRTDIINKIRDYELVRQYGDNIVDTPNHLYFMLDIDSPMLCKPAYNVPQDKMPFLNSLRSNDISQRNPRDWYCEEKIDGMRGIITLITEQDGHRYFHLYSRNISVSDYLPIDYAEKILLPKMCDFDTLPHDMVLDCEIVCTSNHVQCQSKSAQCNTQLQSTTAIISSLKDVALHAQETAPLKFIVFDILSYDTDSTLDLSLTSRHMLLENAMADLRQYTPELNCERVLSCPDDETFDSFYRRIIAVGGEGIVLKRKSSHYSCNGNRNNDWIKKKRRMGEFLDIDAFVSGYALGKEDHEREDVVASLEVSVCIYDNGEYIRDHVIANVANFTEAERYAMTRYDMYGTPYLDPSYYGKVMTIDGQDISSRNARIMHAKLIKWRPDKEAPDCVMCADTLAKFIL